MVLLAKNGNEPWSVCNSHEGPIHLLIADLATHRRCGQEVVAPISRARPSVRVLFLSEYSQQALR
ncbi:MAG: hypothetical protein ACKVK6_15545 [bacterium]